MRPSIPQTRYEYDLDALPRRFESPFGIDRTDPFHATPDPVTGHLLVDPDISLKAKGLDLEINFYYASDSDADDEFGRRRTMSTKSYVLSSTSSGLVSIVRGNFRQIAYNKVGASGGVTTYSAAADQGATSTLSYDGSRFTEYLVSGDRMHYERQLGSGSRHELVGVRNAAGIGHTYVYGSGVEAGLLKTIEVAGGRAVTFGYADGGSPCSLLSYVEDWGGRRWTFQYDSGRQLTTLTTPIGCVTKYGYSLAGTGSHTMLHTIEDPRGYRTTYLYNASRRVASMAAGSAIWTYQYDSLEQYSRVVAPNGVVTSYLMSSGSLWKVLRPDGTYAEYSYSSGFTSRQTTAQGTMSSVTRDSLGRVLVSEDPLGNLTTNQYDASET
ncbi:MAG: RHS repeat protein [Fimbriimonadaceae bacterium]|nr:RHS repeat protein [Fimbriimonadaceae bacterium]